jgi:hypothetical protein
MQAEGKQAAKTRQAKKRMAQETLISSSSA